MRTFFLNTIIRSLIVITSAGAETETVIPSYQQSHQYEHNIDDVKQLTIKNHYGNINYIPWDKNTISVNIVLWAKAPSSIAANEIFKNIIVNNYPTQNGYNYQSHIDPNYTANHNFGIDYQIYGPTDIELIFNNRFGNINVSDFRGAVNINLDFGNFVANDKSYIKNGDIYVANGNIAINEITTAKISHQNGLLTINKAKEISLHSDFIEGNIKEVKQLEVFSRTSEFDIAKVDYINMEAGYTLINVEEITNKGFFNLEKGQIIIHRLNHTVEELTINSKYAPIKINLPNSLNYTLHGEIENGEFSHQNIDQIRLIKENNNISFSGDILSNKESKQITNLILFGKECNIDIGIIK